jgi:hypothetical protein
MKNSPLTTILMAALLISAVASAVMCMMYVSSTREIHSLEAEAAFINNNRAVVNALLNDTIEYSKRNPAMVPILESVGVKPNNNAPASTTSKSATK